MKKPRTKTLDLTPPDVKRRRTWLLLIAAAVMAAAFIFHIWTSRANACGMHYYPRVNAHMSKQGKRWQVTMNYYRKYLTFQGGYQRINKVHVWTANKKTATFFRDKVRDTKLWAAIRTAVSKVNCGVLFQGAKLARLERRIAAALSRFYRQSTRRGAGRIDVMIDVYNASSSCKYR